MSNAIYHQTSAGFAATASAFVVESIGLIIPWLMVMGVLIFCDLVAGIAKAIRLKEKVRFSRAWRDTLAKTCTYFAWVVVACWVQVATGGDVNYSKGACMLVVIIEAASIVSNILKWHGYNLDFGMIVTYFVERLTHAAPHELDGVITKDDEWRDGAAKDGCDMDTERREVTERTEYVGPHSERRRRPKRKDDGIK